MRLTKSIHGRQRIIALCLASTTIGSVGVYAGPRPVGDVTPQGVERVELIGVSRIDELPPLPPNAKANTIVQPLGVPVPVFRVLSDEEMARGTVANTGAATAIVYRNSHDTGWGNFNMALDGGFVGNLLHLGNGFPLDGGEIKGYDLLVYNSVSNPGGEATAYVSLWDGDPLGLIDTRISDPPQEIPGTGCTFTGLVKGGTGGNGCIIDGDGDGVPDTCDGGFGDGWPCEDDTDCGTCPALPSDDIPECPGLFRLECSFPEKVTIPSRNVWMILEWLEGCRMGWRWALLNPPEVAAVGEENFCAGTCPNSPMPCVDLAMETTEDVYCWDCEWFCCADPTVGCDPSDPDACGGSGTCTTGIAWSYDAWCFGAEVYWASFVASIYANTEMTVSVVPRGGIDGVLTVSAPTDPAVFDVFVAGWDPDLDGVPGIKVWQAQIDSSTYVSDLTGSLTNDRYPCTEDDQCMNNAEQEYCTGAGYCGAAWMDCHGCTDPPLCLCIPACDVSSENPRCGSTDQFHQLAYDNDEQNYAMSFRVMPSADFKGCADVTVVPDPATFFKDAISAGIPLVAYIPGTYCVEIGQCCDRSGGPGNEECLDNLTVGECDTLGGLFFPGEACDPDIDDSIECGPFCGDGEVNQASEECDGVDDAACPGLCGLDCLCARFCGDDEVNQPWEQCDGTDDTACPGACGADCLCGPFCGDSVVNQESEVCDGADAIRCPGMCRDDCTCPPGMIPTVSEWGLVALMLLLLSAAKIYGRRRAFV